MWHISIFHLETKIGDILIRLYFFNIINSTIAACSLIYNIASAIVRAKHFPIVNSFRMFQALLSKFAIFHVFPSNYHLEGYSYYYPWK